MIKTLAALPDKLTKMVGYDLKVESISIRLDFRGKKSVENYSVKTYYSGLIISKSHCSNSDGEDAHGTARHGS